jgi:hypothetical protein
MMVLDYLSVPGSVYLSEIREVNKRLQKRGLDASAIVAILPHMVESKQYGLIVYYKRDIHNGDDMVFSKEELNV